MREAVMNPVAKALWFIESHFAGDVTLAEIPESPASRAFTWYGHLV
jgi:hypothetical protein